MRTLRGLNVGAVRCIVLLSWSLSSWACPVAAQEAAPSPDSLEAATELPRDSQVPDGPLEASTDAADEEAVVVRPKIDLLSLILKGRWLMLPIGLMSVAVVTIVIERGLAMRRKRVIPGPLVAGLAKLGNVPGVMDPRCAYALCQQYPSPAAVVIRSMLLKIGRPHSEVEHAVAEASEREAERLYSTARWLTLIAAIAPLTGLLGTVWGMIRAFFETTQLPLGQNKADFLAQGIYIALVTTLGGLVVAIPAAIFAHYFESRVVRLFHEIDELLFSLMPQIERYEGRMRVTPRTLGDPNAVEDEAPSAPDPPQRNPAKAV